MLSLCGGVTVSGELGTLGPRALGGARFRHILIALSARTGQPVSKVQLVHLLWGDEPPAGAIGTLETYISRLRQRFDSVATEGGAVIRTVPGGYALDPAGIAVDVDDFTRACRGAREPDLPAAVALERWSIALHTITGDFLAGEAGPPWVDDARHLHQVQLAGALAEAAETALRDGSGVAAGRFAARGLAVDKLHESCWRLLLESFEARGLHGEGVRAYDDCRRVFAEELGCAPGLSVRTAFERLLTGTGGSGPVADDGLTAAVQAVVRLYTVVTPDDARRRRTAEVTSAPSVVAEAYQLLHGLLQQADAMTRQVPMTA
jgi:DNA-binding SARP family transcriptional activator